jgi:UDP-N-acetylglucosamine:LPS N-acetylglucosamine transferase
MASIAKSLPNRQLIFLCGHNERLASRLRALPRVARHAVLGFTSEVGRYMELADYFIGKPGPGSVSEAVCKGLPVVTFDNAWTMPQERFNAHWVRDRRLGVVLPSIGALGQGVADLLAELPAYRERVKRIDNRAVFELPALLEAQLRRPADPPLESWSPRSLATH